MINEAPHFEDRLHEDAPTIEDIHEYIDFMRETLRSVGRSTRTFAKFKASAGGHRITANYAGKEFYLPGSLTEWSIPNKEGRTEQLRDRSFVMSVCALGETGAKLCVIETDAVRSKRLEGDVYNRHRATYQFGWDTRVGVYQAKKNIVDMVIPTIVDAEVLPRMEFDAPDKLVFDMEATETPMRVDYGWEPVNQADVDGLLYRTHEYQRELLVQQANRASLD